jgi:hypothetical protein
MRRILALSTATHWAKWCGCALLLLLPGSFLALPLIWALRRRRLAGG